MLWSRELLNVTSNGVPFLKFTKQSTKNIYFYQTSKEVRMITQTLPDQPEKVECFLVSICFVRVSPAGQAAT
jgi:hypothetical protein